MTYILIKRTSYNSRMFEDTFTVVEQSRDVNEIKKKKDAHEILKSKDESFNIVMFESEETDTTPVNHDQLELPFPEVQ